MRVFGSTVPLRSARESPHIAAFCSPVRPWCDLDQDARHRHGRWTNATYPVTQLVLARVNPPR
jgi:hypothetical protein